jgi:transcriptional regulator with XRE-family HTH domain
MRLDQAEIGRLADWSGSLTPLVSSAQCRAARALLGWTQAILADRAGVGRKTVAHFEIGRRDLKARTRREIMATLEHAGVEFLWPGPGGEGVRLLRNAAGVDRGTGAT